MNGNTDHNRWGVGATLLSTLFSGLAPIFGKFAYHAGMDPSTLVALRTVIAAGMLWLIYLLFWRRQIAIKWHDLVGCIGMGVANGIGSLLYYNGLARVDASLSHLLYSMYPFWVFIFLSAAGHPVSRLAVLRLGMALLSVFLLTWQGAGLVDPLGVTLMLGAGALYGWHLVLGQWTLADVDSRTVTLYGLTTMAVVVGFARLVQGRPLDPISAEGWTATLLLAIFPTAMARLLVFAGLRRLGGFQTSLLGLSELLVAVGAAFALFGETFSVQQWIGVGMFVASVLLISRDTSLQITDEESWWQSLFPDEAEEEGIEKSET
jgi:drug/metabolite transporter (DMT)-like permease